MKNDLISKRNLVTSFIVIHRRSVALVRLAANELAVSSDTSLPNWTGHASDSIYKEGRTAP